MTLLLRKKKSMMGKNKFITIEQMGDIAAKILNNSGYSLEWKGSVEAVPIEDIIEIDYGLEWKWGDLSYLNDEKVMAALYPRSRELVLNLQFQDLFKEKFGTMMFSLAHELGHWMLHAEDVEGLQTPMFENNVFYCRGNGEKTPIEYQADLFASCLLMPEAIITPLIQNLWSKDGRVTWKQLYQIAEEFQVSISALTIRLQQLRLLYIDGNKYIYHSREEAMGQQILF